MRLTALPLLLIFAVPVVCAQTQAAPASKAPASTQDTKRDPSRTEPGGDLQRQPAPAASPAAAAVPLDAPVIIIKGGCADAAPAATKTPCKRQVTRAEFERLIKALNPEMPPNVRESFAQNYGKLLVISNEARKRGVQNSPNLQLLYEFAKLQVLTAELGKQLQRQAQEIPPATVEAYYKEHLKDYESAEMQRVIIPRPAPGKEKPADDAAEKEYAQKLRDRWVAGEDPAKLQAEAYQRADNKAQPPAIDLGQRRRGAVQVEAPVFDLKPGEISQPIDNQSAYFIFKLLKKEVAPFESVRDEIKRNLSNQRLQQEMEKVTNSGEVTLNNSYFGTTSEPASGKPGAAPNPGASARPSGVKPKIVK